MATPTSAELTAPDATVIQNGESMASNNDVDSLKSQEYRTQQLENERDFQSLASAGGNSHESAGNNELSVPKQQGERPTSIVPPFWQHSKPATRISVISNPGVGGIRLEDNTLEDGADIENLDQSLKSPLWARQVEIDEYVRIEGDIKGVGGYIVWLVRIQTLEGGNEIVLRKRYSEFETLHSDLQATFPNAGSSLPTLPPKSVFYKFKPSFLEKRRVGLKYFLNCVLLNPEFSGCPAVREFVFG